MLFIEMKKLNAESTLPKNTFYFKANSFNKIPLLILINQNKAFELKSKLK